MTSARLDWVYSEDLIAIFEMLPLPLENYTSKFEFKRGNLTVHFTICQADRFACIDLFAGVEQDPIIRLELPNYSWVRLVDEPSNASITIGPPKNVVELESGGACIVCPVTLRLRPAIGIEIERLNDRTRID